MMKKAALTILVAAVTSIPAFAQDKVIVDERPGVTVQTPGVAVEKRDKAVIEKREVEKRDCESKTVRKDSPEGSKTVTKERCD